MPNSWLIKAFLVVTISISYGCGGGSGGSSAIHSNESINGSNTTENHPETPTAEEPSVAEEQPPVEQPPVETPPVTPSDLTINNKKEASRFLTQATFGPTQDAINRLMQKTTYKKWLDEQFALAPSYHLPRVKNLTRKMCMDKYEDGSLAIDTWGAVYSRHQVWWETALKNDDQLRQRVAFALSEIMVISDSSGLGLSDTQYGVTSYYDVLVKHAFGNYRDLLTDITLHPAMGIFLGMVRNQKSDEQAGIRPDENFARELLQLFTIGVHQLNLDGTPKLDETGSTIPTYDQKIIQEFARIYTGWNFAGIDWHGYFGNADRTKPMVAVEEFHDTERKILLNNEVIPAGNTARQDLDAALDNIFKHPNLGPFIGKQLIQRLVKSNPSPAYVSRVASIFNDNGSGVRGDMKAVISSILLDKEARNLSLTDNKAGKLKEPLLRVSHLWRAFNLRTISRSGQYWEPEKTCGQGNYDVYKFYFSLDYLEEMFGQGPLQAKSVFNFFSPSFTPPGELNNAAMLAPEFQMVTENSLVNSTNSLHNMIYFFSNDQPGLLDSEEYSKLDLSRESELAKDPEKLLDHLSLILLNNRMSAELRNILLKHLNAKDVYPDGKEGFLAKAREALALIIIAPEYLIQQ